MNVKIIDVKNNKIVEASISNIKHLPIQLPTFTDGWRFSFRKHAKHKNFQTYVLTCDQTPSKVEGCLIFELKDKVEPYLAYVEVAPHNRGIEKEKDRIAGVLIAFACRLSFIQGFEAYQGWLALDVLEKNKEDEIKLMALYSLKYNALRFGETTMVIPPEGGEKLIDEYLKF